MLCYALILVEQESGFWKRTHFNTWLFFGIFFLENYPDKSEVQVSIERTDPLLKRIIPFRQESFTKPAPAALAGLLVFTLASS